MRNVTVEVEPEQPPPMPMADASDSQDQGLAEDDEPAATVSVPKKKDKPQPREPGAADTTPFREQRTSEDRLTKEWLDSIAPGGVVKVVLERRNPKIFKGKNVGGALATYDEFIDEEFISATHGGGTYQIIVRKPNPKGTGYVYAGGKSIQIAGDPRTDDVYRDGADQGSNAAAAAVQANSAATDRAMATMEKLLEKSQRDGARGPDLEMIRMMTEPLKQQIAEMAQTLRAKDSQLLSASARAPEKGDEFRDKLLDKMLDTENVRITSLRAQFESELRQAKDLAIANEARLRDSFDRDKVRMEAAHEREIGSLKQTYDMRCSSLETTNSVSMKLLDGEVRRLQDDLAEAKAERNELRLKKEKSPIELLKDVAAIREAVGDNDEKDEKSGWAVAAETLGSIPAVQGLIAKIGGGGAEAAPVQQLRPPARPVRNITGPDGNLYVQMSDGTSRLAATTAQRRHHQETQKAAAAAARARGETAPMPDLPPATVKLAVDYLDNAFRGNQDPDQVATSVRSMIPSEVMAVIKERGIEAFLEAAKLDTTSQLASQGGRNWIRKVGKALVGG